MTVPRPPLRPEDKAFVDAVVRFALILLIVGQAGAGWTDSDIWGHMSIGLDMLATGQFLWVDPYSFTHDQAWINHEWLWDVAIAAVYRIAGLPGIVAVRVVLIGLVLWVVDRSTRTVAGWTRLFTLSLVALGCISQWRSTRPQIVTLTIYAILLAHIDAWWLPLLFAVWANLHGGWLFGLGAVVVYALTYRSRRSALIAVGCAVATLVNPYGFHLWLALADATIRGWADVSEWQPIWRIAAGIDALLLWLLLAASTAALWLSSASRTESGHVRVARTHWAWVWSLVAMLAAANSRRLTALAALTGAILLVQRWAPPASSAAMGAIHWTVSRRWVMAGTVAAATAGAMMSLQASLPCFPPLSQWRAPEPDSVAFLRASNVRRLVPHFDFGEYAIFHLRDRMQVAIDNRRETVYSDAAVWANQRFADGLDPEYPERIGADAVWWPTTGSRVLEGLEQRGWVRRFVGPRTVVLLRSDGEPVYGRDAVGTPCFPNP